MDDRQARLSLASAIDGGDPVVAELVAERGAVEARGMLAAGHLGPEVAERVQQTNLLGIQRLAELSRIRFVVPGDDEWPAGMGDLAGLEPIQRRGGVPLGLWVRGPGQLADWLKQSVAIVGSRAATPYGSGVAADFAHDLVQEKYAVVSGGAFGIDTAAHRGALAGGGRTICVLANGLDIGYPRSNDVLFAKLAREQLLVSELPPGAHPTRVRFLARNRLIAAMSGGTVVVEAALRSGARNTASWAAECSRPLMAVPGSVHARASAAPHLMIRSGQAVLVTSAADILELVSPMGQGMLPLNHGPVQATDGLTEAQLRVFEMVPARRRLTAGEIARAATVSMPTCLAALAALEDIGLVTVDERGWLALPAGLRAGG